MTDRIVEIKDRLSRVSGHAWTYDPKHEMFIGTTNAIKMYDRTIDLGRDESGCRERTKALGDFLENCREDIEFLLTKHPEVKP